MRDPVLPENHRVYRMLPWIVPNGQHKINAANRGPPHHFSENGLFVLLVLLVNPALAVVPSHHPDDTGGKQKNEAGGEANGGVNESCRHKTGNGIQVWQHFIESVWKPHGSTPCRDLPVYRLLSGILNVAQTAQQR
jgi:hypothetical protein